MNNKKNEKNELNKPETNKESFIYKYKNDTKYKAKVELTGYVVFILVIIIFVNVASLGSSKPSNSLVNEILSNNTNNSNTTTETEKHLLDEITNNYQYDININLVKTTEETINYHYYGKSYENTLEITKETAGLATTYYKVDDYYYQKGEQDYIMASSTEIYDLISNNYIELDHLLDYINEASLDHVTNYSSGKKESVYNLYIRDIIISNKTDDTVTINIIEENDTLIITVDYFNLIKQTDDTITECKVNYTFSNINNIEEFFVLEESESTGEVNE